MSETRLGSGVRSVLELLARADPAKPALDRRGAEQALLRHLRVAESPMRSRVIWVDDAARGYLAVWERAWSCAVRLAGRSRCRAPVYVPGEIIHRAWPPPRSSRLRSWPLWPTVSEGRLLSELESAARFDAWSRVTRLVESSAREACRHRAAMNAGRAPSSSVMSRRRADLAGAAWSAVRRGRQLSAVDMALGLAHLCCMRDEARRRFLIVRHAAKMLPLARAWAAGLFCHWVCEDAIVAVPRPAMSLADHALHNDRGPAVWWPAAPGGHEYYFLNGVRVTKHLVMTPSDRLDPAILLRETNVEVRREIVRKVDIENVCRKLNARTIDKRGEYELVELPDLGDSSRRVYLRMRNPSTGAYHLEGVGPECRNIKESLAWRNGRKDPPAVLW